MTRRTSTDAELDEAILEAPIRWAYARDVDPDTDGPPGWDWLDSIPPHVVIAALSREVRTLSEVVDRERARARKAEAVIDALGDAARGVIQARAEMAMRGTT